MNLEALEYFCCSVPEAHGKHVSIVANGDIGFHPLIGCTDD